MKNFVIASALLVTAASTAHAFEATVITDAQITLGLNGPWTLGYSFTPNANLTVTALGAFAARTSYVREIGIWDSAGSLLMSGKVDGSEAVTNFMNYTSSFMTHTGSGASLLAGQNYTVGATAIDGDGTWALNVPFNVNSNITYNESRFSFGGSLSNPLSNIGSDTYFGGSFQADLSRTQAVPEPCTMLAIGLSAAAYVRRKVKA